MLKQSTKNTFNYRPLGSAVNPVCVSVNNLWRKWSLALRGKNSIIIWHVTKKQLKPAHRRHQSPRQNQYHQQSLSCHPRLANPPPEQSTHKHWSLLSNRLKHQELHSQQKLFFITVTTWCIAYMCGICCNNIKCWHCVRKASFWSIGYHWTALHFVIRELGTSKIKAIAP